MGPVLATVAAILVLVLSPAPDWPEAGRRFLVSLVPTTVTAWKDILANVALYGPLGLTLALAGTRTRRVWLTGLTLSVATEALQSVIPGRDPRASDIVANSIGAGLGAAAAHSRAGQWLFLHLHRPRWTAAYSSPVWVAPLASFASAAALVLLLGVSGLLVQPSLPGPAYAISSARLDTAPGGLRIGSNGHDDSYFRGAIDEVRVYGRALSIEEIQRDMQNPIAGASPTGDLVAALGFDDAVGPTTPNAVGSEGAISIRGQVRQTQGRHGGALLLDGKSYLTLASTPGLDLRDAYTIEAWVRPADQTSSEPVIVAHDGDVYHLAGARVEGRFRPSTGGVFGGAHDDARFVDSLIPDRWSHLAASYDAQVFRLYVDGQLIRSRRRWSPHESANVSLNERPMTTGIVANGPWLQAALAEPFTLDASIVCGTPNETPAPVFRIVAPGNRTLFAITAADRDLLVQWSTRPGQMRMPSPPLTIARALDGCVPGKRVHLALEGRLPSLRATLDGRALAVDTPGLESGWAFLFYASLMPRWLRSTCTWLWLGMLAALVAVFPRSATSALIDTLVVVAGIAVLPGLVGVAPLGALHLSALATGAAVGVFLRRRRSASRLLAHFHDHNR